MDNKTCPECEGSGLSASQCPLPTLIQDVYDTRCYWCDGTGINPEADNDAETTN